MRPYRLMIIDDNYEERSLKYEKVFSSPNFQIISVKSLAHLKEIADITSVDGYVVDVFLDTGDWYEVGNAGALFSKSGVLSNPPQPAPVFLVSQRWGDDDAIEVLNSVNRRSDIEVLRYLAWTEFQSAVPDDKSQDVEKQRTEKPDNSRLSALRRKMLDDLSSWHEFSTFRPADDATITILLLADLQYTDKHTSPTGTFDEHRIVKALNRDEVTPDLLVLAGDIGCTGAPNEYAQAKEKLEENLMELMWGVDSLDKMRERVILVPGNHDVNLRFASCEKYDWNRDDKAWIDKAMPVKSDEDREDSPMLANHNDYSLEPFRQFARSLTGSRLWDGPRVKSRVDRRFEPCGIRFYLFNSVSSATVDNPKIANFSKDDLGKINKSLIKDGKPEDIFSIAVSHHGIQTGSSREQMENWKSLGEGYFTEHKIRLWMFGHYHDSDFQPHNLTSGVLGLIQAPTLKIETSEAVCRGFTLVELARSKGRVTSAKIYPYSFDKNGVCGEKPTPKEISWL